MYIKYVILIFLFLCASFSPVFCIDNENTYITGSSGSDMLNSIQKQFLTNNCYEICAELHQIESMLRNKAPTLSDNELLKILMYICYCDKSNLKEKDALSIKKKTVELIGLIGKQGRQDAAASIAKNVLIDVLSKEDEVTISSLCIHSLGMIGIDQDGHVVTAINDAMDRQHNKFHDDVFGLAVVNAIEQIAIVNNGIDDWRVFVSLIQIIQGNYDMRIKGKAIKILEKLKIY